jgi:hypothetical protein
MRIGARRKDDIVIFDLEGELRRSDTSDVTLHQLVKEELDKGSGRLSSISTAWSSSTALRWKILATHFHPQLGGKIRLVKLSKSCTLFSRSPC